MRAAPTTDAAERAFYVEEFAGATIVAALVAADDAALAGLASSAASLAEGGSRLLTVIDADRVDAAARALGSGAVVVDVPSLADPHRRSHAVASLWLALADAGRLVIGVPAGEEARVAAEAAAAVRATKLVLTDPAGGWGRPPRSFADVATHEEAFRSQLADRQAGAVVDALTRALAAGVGNVNLCRAQDVDRELFTFDGAGTLFTSGGYVEVTDLGVDDLPAVERLVAQGVADGLLRPRPRLEVARLAATGLGARVVGSGHLAGIVSLETEPYGAEPVGELASLYTVSRFSGAGAGALLVEGAMGRAADLGLERVFAVTVSDAAAAFFVRRGFAEVDQARVPAAKWAGYDAERRRTARAFLRSVAPLAAGAAQGTLGF